MTTSSDGATDTELPFRQVAQKLPTPCWISDAEGRIVWVNDAWLDYTGADVAHVEKHGLASLHDPAIYPSVVAQWAQIKQAGAPADVRFPLRGRDGTLREFHTRLVPLRDATGSITRWFGTNTDVSENSRIEQAFVDARERLTLATEAAGIGTWDYNPVSGELKWDARCKQLFGLPAASEVTYEGAFLAGIHPEDRERAHQAVEASLSGKGSSRYDIEYRTVGLVDRVERWVAATGNALFSSGRAIRFIGTVRDISDRKTAERRFEILNRTAAMVAADLDINRIVQAVTDAGVELTGAQFGAFFYRGQDDAGEWYTFDSLSGVPREAFSNFPMPRKTAIFGPTFNNAGIVRSDDIQLDPRYGLNAPYNGMPEGHLPVRSYLAVPVVSGGGEGIGGLFLGHEAPAVFKPEHEEVLRGMAAHAATAIENARLLQATRRELNERRRAEETIKRNEARLAFLDRLTRATADASDASAVMATTTRMVGEHLGVDICAYADMEEDEESFTIRGDWSREGIPSIVGTYSLASFGELALRKLHAGEPLILNDNIREIGEEQSAMFLRIGIRSTICMPFIRRGKLAALMAIHHAQPYMWSEEELALLNEVTERSWAHIERVRTAADLRDLNATLEDRVANEVAARLRVEAQLHQAQKMDAIGQLTGGIAHDFNNMLSVVVGGLQLTRRRLRAGNTEVDSFIEGAIDGAQRAAALTQRLLAFSRQQPLAPEIIQPNNLLTAMTELLSRALGEAIQIQTLFAPNLWLVKVDPVQLESAILNLCVNSRDAMPQGGKLTIETANVDAKGDIAKVDVLAGEYVRISVLDTGEGMTQGILSKAFDPFFTTKPVGKGSGLGLSQVLGFIQQSGGQVRIVSSPQKGTAVHLYLARHEGEGLPADARGNEREPETRPPTETVLLVEDDDRVRSFAASALAELGYSVVAASGGPEALRLLTTRPDVTLLFTDVVMPEMTGRELADAAIEARPDLKVLFATGYAGQDVLHQGRMDPGSNVLQKPFTLDQLASKIRSVLDAG